jgi:hypothetical protein
MTILSFSSYRRKPGIQPREAQAKNWIPASPE